jgi:pyruvate dehydrogenase E2 component (dihydrolipoamide acetyltransferase)
VRKLARSLGVDLSSLARGSGPGGVITRADIFAASAPTTEASDEVILLRGIRARIADRMTTSRSRIPDATCSVEVDCSRLVEVRATLDGVAGESCHITPFALLCRLLVLTLRHHPILNATFVDDTREIRVHRAIHLGVATATDRGLVVPVVRDAHQLSTAELAGRITDLAAGARAGTLAPADLTGSTFTVSNFGAFGLDDGVPVINHPEAAIVGIGAIKPRPLVVDGKVVARLTARVTCAFDHRVCDGAEAGAFLAALRKVYESPELGLLDA